MYIVIDVRRIGMGVIGGVLVALLLMTLMDLATNSVTCGIQCVSDNIAELSQTARNARLTGSATSKTICLKQWRSLDFTPIINDAGASGASFYCVDNLCDIGRLAINNPRISTMQKVAFSVDMQMTYDVLNITIKGPHGNQSA